MIDESIKEYYYNIYKKFYLNTGVMSCFVKSLIFASAINLKNFNIDFDTKVDFGKIKPIQSKESLIILDISGDRGLEYAYKYKDEYTIIPDFNMVCHDFGIVKSKPILKNLSLFLNANLKLLDKYMIILDSNRYRDGEVNSIYEYNNQYEITEEDLPEIQMLNYLKIDGICYIYDEKIKEDANEYLNYLECNNIRVNIFKLK